MTTLNHAQLRVLRCLLAKGWPVDLEAQLLNRNGTTAAEIRQLLDAGVIEVMTVGRSRRYHLTAAGKKTYKRQAKGQYF